MARRKTGNSSRLRPKQRGVNRGRGTFLRPKLRLAPGASAEESKAVITREREENARQ